MPVLLPDDDVAELCDGLDPSARAERHRGRALFDPPAGNLGVLRLQRP